MRRPTPTTASSRMVTCSAGQDERIITTVYAINTNAWILRHPARQETSGLTSGVLSRVESYYDDETFSGNNFGQVTVGNLTLRREWTDASNPGAYVQSARTKYDGFGNPITLLDPLAVAAGARPISPRDMAARLLMTATSSPIPRSRPSTSAMAARTWSSRPLTTRALARSPPRSTSTATRPPTAMTLSPASSTSSSLTTRPPFRRLNITTPWLCPRRMAAWSTSSKLSSSINP